MAAKLGGMGTEMDIWRASGSVMVVCVAVKGGGGFRDDGLFLANAFDAGEVWLPNLIEGCGLVAARARSTNATANKSQTSGYRAEPSTFMSSRADRIKGGSMPATRPFILPFMFFYTGEISNFSQRSRLFHRSQAREHHPRAMQPEVGLPIQLARVF